MGCQDSSTLHGAGVHRDKPHDLIKTQEQVRRSRQPRIDPLRESRPYSEVHCLQFSWQETNLNPGDDLWNLRSCLEFGLFWNVEKHEIPTAESDAYVRTKVDGLLKLHGNKQTALIVILYSGHSYIEDEQMFWTGSHASVSWKPLQQDVRNGSNADVLFILDTCNAGKAARGPSALSSGLKDRYSNGRRISKQEVLGACDMEDITPGEGDDTYVKCLLQHLIEITRSRYTRTTDNIQSMLTEDRDQDRLTVNPFRRNLITNQYPIVLEPCYRNIHIAIRRIEHSAMTTMQDSTSHCYVVILAHDREMTWLYHEDLVTLMCSPHKSIEYVVSKYIYVVEERCQGTISLKYCRTVLAPETTIKELRQLKRTSVGDDFADDKLFVLQAIEEQEDDGNSDDGPDGGSDSGSDGDASMNGANVTPGDDCDVGDVVSTAETCDASDSGCDVEDDALMADMGDGSDDDSDS